jgi:hypothetical protein
MFYVVNNHLNNLYVLSNKAVGPGKKSKIINVGPTSIPEARVSGSMTSTASTTSMASMTSTASFHQKTFFLDKNVYF